MHPIVQWSRYIVVVLVCLLLQACTSTRLSPELRYGKITFAAGNYREAFHYLLPLAANGDPEAQYAVGYMYYYGLGIPQDTESGLFWIHRSGRQGYLPANRALYLIRQTPQPVPATTKKCNVESEHSVVPTSLHRYKDDPVLDTLPPRPKKFLIPEKRPDKIKISLNAHIQNETTASVPSKKFTLQLFGSHQLASVKALQAELGLKKVSNIWRTTYEGKDWYVLTYGSYDSSQKANLARNTLPTEMNTLHPWARDLHSLEQS